MGNCCCRICYTTQERRLAEHADSFFDVMNTRTCCGMRDDKLDKKEVRLLMAMMDKEAKQTLFPHAAIIEAIKQQLVGRQIDGGDGGENITRDEFVSAILGAFADYQDMLSQDCFACCMSHEMRRLRGTAEYFFDAVNTDTCCCCFKDGRLDRSETRMMLISLEKEAHTTLHSHAGFIIAMMEQLKAMTVSGGDGGSDITRDEFVEAILAATANYQQKAIAEIACEFQKNMMGGY